MHDVSQMRRKTPPLLHPRSVRDSPILISNASTVASSANALVFYRILFFSTELFPRFVTPRCFRSRDPYQKLRHRCTSCGVVQRFGGEETR